MADVYTTPATATTGGNIGAAFWNTNGRDNVEAVFNGLTGDTSTDTDVKHAHKVGLFSARPAASKAGRLYYASDIDALFHDTGAAWKHLTGRGVGDSFERANANPFDSAPEQTADSGHSWSQAVGTQQLLTNGLQAVTLSGSISVATVETGGLIETGTYVVGITTGATVSSINVACVLKYVSSTVLLYVQLHGTLGFRMVKDATLLGSLAFTPAASTFYTMIINANPAYVTAQLMSASSFVGHIAHANPANITTPYVTATKAGVLFGTAAHDRIEAFSFKPN